MDIELYKADKLNQKGSSLRKQIQNNTTPVLDLLVREAVQNSLDARDNSSKSSSVNVEFTVGSFNRATMEKELERVDFASKKNWGNKFIAVRDSNTTGLTGRYENKGSNLFKLVYGIMEAQKASGAGGSWGIGKTVYFRVGTGLVIYYSRVKTDDGYESLLAADFVEDEARKDALLPAVDGEKYGIAFWGKKIRGKDSVKECRDSKAVTRMLKAFDIKPFEEDETGTVIIIPYINEKALLKNNVTSEDGSGTSSPFWTKDVAEYLRISVQRWYSARLANRKYQGKYLNVKVNGKSIRQSDMEPFFQVTQALYNKAALTLADSTEADLVTIPDTEIFCEEIRINSQINPNTAGIISFAKVSRRQLGMTPPDNCPSPYVYVNSVLDEDDFGKPVIMYCRKPGMVVSYEVKDSGWVSGIPATEDDEFLIGYFVLNQEPLLQNVVENLSLEDYVRKTEKADHAAWEDVDLTPEFTVTGGKPTIISKIRKNVARKVAGAFAVEEDEEEKTSDSGLSTLLGRILLPPEGFGRKPSQSPAKAPGENPSTTHKNIRFSYHVSEFTPDGMKVELHATSGKRSAEVLGFEFKMDSVAGPISAASWEEETSLDVPFTLKEVEIKVNKLDGRKSGACCLVDDPGDDTAAPLKFGRLLSKASGWYGLSIEFLDGTAHQFDINMTLDVAVSRKDVKPVLSFDF